jgi:hypothetical protein
MKVTVKPEPRVQHSYNGIVTILEGSELAALTRIFFGLLKSKSQKLQTDPMGKVVYCALTAYRKLYRAPVCSVEELKNLSSADARKADLFFKYACVMIEKAQNGTCPSKTK